MDPLYDRLARELRECIVTGVYGAGERLPGVRTLSRTRGVSVATVLAAYRRLEDDVLIEARPRSGYYVRNRPTSLAMVRQVLAYNLGVIRGPRSGIKCEDEIL